MASIHGCAGSGKSIERLYHIWTGIRQRCNNQNRPDYHRYGGRGIKVTTQWDTYAVFRAWAIAAGYEIGLLIDRTDNDGDYSPENCKFVTISESNRNKCDNRFVTAFGETKCFQDWIHDPRCRVSHSGLRSRLNRGWPPERAISAEPIPRKYRNGLHPDSNRAHQPG
jgi:hypothetical protein